MIDPARVAEALAVVRERIRSAGGDDGVAVLAVTKGFGADAVSAAALAGCTMVGENYAHEVIAKRDAFAAAGVAVHFIGQLQSNKVRQLTGLIDVYQSVDRESLVAELARRAPGAEVLVQVAGSAEVGKGGCPPDAVAALVETASAAGLHVRGLMAVGPTLGGPEAARPVFRTVRALVDELGLDVCSMGMTDDLEVAVSEGSTLVRVGTALFGPRSRPSSDDTGR